MKSLSFPLKTKQLLRIPLLVFVFNLFFFTGKAQNNHIASLEFTTENDSYRWNRNDRFYTSGMFLQLHYIPRLLKKKITPDTRLKKVTGSYTLGQLMYTPSNRTTRDITRIDRPYAGYLFLQKNYTLFYKKSVLQAGINIGTTGKASAAQSTQNFIHDLLGFNHFRGWEYQVKNEAGINLRAQYDYNFFSAGWIDVSVTTEGSLGNIFTNAAAGMMIRLGLFDHASRSSYYNARIGNDVFDHPAELYIYFRPLWMHQFYNATVQGRFWGNNAGSVVKPLERNIYEQQWGIVFAKNRWEVMMNYSFKQKEVAAMKANERFGAFGIAYKFGKPKKI